MPKRFKAAELKVYKEALIKLKIKITGDYSHLGEGVINHNVHEASGDISSVPLHIADIGSDNYEQDMTLGLMENENESLKAIDEALERILDKSYGECGNCDKMIPKARLKALPFVRYCIPCQTELENQ